MTHSCSGRQKKKLNIRSVSQRHRHFIGFFNMPIPAPTRATLLWLFRENAPFQLPFTMRMRIQRTYSRLKPPGTPRCVYVCVFGGGGCFPQVRQENVATTVEWQPNTKGFIKKHCFAKGNPCDLCQTDSHVYIPVFCRAERDVWLQRLHYHGSQCDAEKINRQCVYIEIQ